MLDLKLIRDDPDVVREGVRAKGEDPARVDEARMLDAQRRELLQQTEALKNRRNTVSAEVARLKARKEDPTALIVDMRAVSDDIKGLDERVRQVDTRLREVLLLIPNLPHPSVPPGRTPEENVVVHMRGEMWESDFPLLPHWELSDKLHLFDFPRGGKIAGTGFPVAVGKGARLERALTAFFLDEAEKAGYTEISPPLLVNAESATGTGQLPDKEDQMYVVERDGLYLVPTAEVPVTNFYRDEVLEEENLPVRFCAATACFRRESGSYGKDVRGLNRVHQFYKVELVSFAHPARSYDELERMRGDAERLLQKLGLRYRVLLMCAGDLGFTQAKKYDLEVWSAGQQRWLEVSSLSNFEAYQARRLNLRFRSAGGGKPEMVHTLNGSALALPRTLAALMEHYQTPEGKVVVPKALHRYTGFEILG
jgi:seryl-tRNA synthetase